MKKQGVQTLTHSFLLLSSTDWPQKSKNLAKRKGVRLTGIAACAVLLLCAAPAWGDDVPLSSRVVTTEGKSLVVIANSFLELTFDPARGGRCVSFRFMDNDEQIIGKAAESGMFIDHWAKYPWPSGLMHLPYEYELIGDGTTQVGVRLWVTVPAQGGGKGAPDPESSAKIPTSPDLVGLVVRKTIWLNAINDAIQVEHEIENRTSESRGVAPYIQHNLQINGSRFYDNWYLPSTRGVLVNVQPSDERGKAVGPDWVLDPTAGWMAVLDRKTKRGLLFAFDYNYLEKIYTCGMTAEWFMEVVPIGAGKTFKTHYTIKPLEEFEDVVFGSKNVVADLRPDERGRAVLVTHDIAAVSKPLSDVCVDFRVVGWKSKEIITVKSFTLKKLGFGKVRQQFTFKPQNLSDGVVFKVTIRGSDFEERYEYYYAGDKEEHERRYNYFATKGGALAGVRGDAYFQKQPRKIKKFDKPDFSKVGSPAPDRFKCLVVFGLYTHILKIDDALDGWKHRGINPPQFTWANCPPNAVENFPGSYEELFSYNTVVLSDVNYKALGDIGFEMLCDYVEQGGSLLVTGGPYAFGNGEFEGTRFLQVLPVTLSGPFDLKWAGKGKSWPLTPASSESALLAGISFSQNPRVFWHHFVTPKSDAEVILKAGEQPALIIGRYGKGKVAVLTLSPTGKAAPGETEWWNWDGWSQLVKNIFSWLNTATEAVCEGGD